VGALENGRRPAATAAVSRAAASSAASIYWLVWVAFALGVASAPGTVLGLFGLPLGLAAAALSLVALLRLADMPPGQRRGQMLTLLGLAFGVFQVVFVLVGFYFVNVA
jgi:hypothetical protein